MFDTPYYRDCKTFKDHKQLKENLLSRRHEFCVFDNIFYGKGYSTIGSQENLHKEYPYFTDYILGAMREYDDKLKVTRMWVNINPTGAYQTRHNHADSDFAGTYYLQVPEEDSGSIQFYNPSPVVEAMHRMRPYHNFTHMHIPTETDLMIWPGFLDHEVMYNHSDKERWTVSFLMSLTDEDRRDRFPGMIQP